ncbi:MAG: hypothetical protein P8075_10490 [Deltaproteobacteria bacterium]|jgi:hypothetical protein
MMPLFDDKTTERARKEHRAETDFMQARQKAFWDEIKGFILRRSNRLLPFDEVKDKLEVYFPRELGVQTVPIDSIVGSEGRYRSFTRHFHPLDDNLGDRWKKVVEAHYAKQSLPPVALYKVCDAYFVKDGHHRISVARTKGVKHIEALIYEYVCDVYLDKDTDLEKLAIQAAYHRFLEDTRLGKTRPNPGLQLTLLGGYPILMEHIQAHKYYLEDREGREVSLPDAACSWYDSVYTPLADAIRKNRIMQEFPLRTETDFYLWIIQHRSQLSDHFGWAGKADRIVEAYTQKYSGPWRRAIGAFKRMLGLVRYR